jgi:mannose/cellobiose epimerase-like protein (N-acyl-D-glucosamine 2-epimerase family)
MVNPQRGKGDRVIEVYEEFRKLTIDELIGRVNQRFDAAHKAASMQIMGSHGPAGHLLEAQFYMNEIDRRHENKWIWISFISELLIILLIIAEIGISITRR